MHKIRIALTATALLAVLAALAGPAGGKTVARGLDNPRGLVVLPDGGLVVAEAGHAGSFCLGPGQCLGLNGQVSVINGGRRVAVATGLPSFGGPFGTFGLGHLAWARGALQFIVGLNPQAFGDPAEDCKGQADSCVALVSSMKDNAGILGRLKSLQADRGWTTLAGVGAFDFDYAAAHPDPGNPEYAPGDGNPFGLLKAPAGGFYVVDAASNTLDLVARDGSISVLAFVPDPPGHKPIYDAAPTCAASTPNGDVLVATESSSLWRWDGTRLKKVLSGGRLGQVISCVADKQGNLYLVNLTSKVRGSFPNFVLKPSDGSIVKVTPRLQTSTIATGLNFPTGIALAPGGGFYITVNGLCPSDLSLLNSDNSPAHACPAAGKIVQLNPYG